jgi:pilus assembly protein CpaB
VLKEGTRAVAIGVDPISGVAGLIWPGDHVDIILTQDIEKAALAQRTLSETILTDVRIIAIDQEMVQGAATAAGKLVRTVTVEVEPGQAEQIAVASHIGKLTLSIRAAMDASMAARRVTYGGDVSPALAHAEGERRATVTVFEGKERKDVSFP